LCSQRHGLLFFADRILAAPILPAEDYIFQDSCQAGFNQPYQSAHGGLLRATLDSDLVDGGVDSTSSHHVPNDFIPHQILDLEHLYALDEIFLENISLQFNWSWPQTSLDGHFLDPGTTLTAKELDPTLFFSPHLETVTCGLLEPDLSASHSGLSTPETSSLEGHGTAPARSQTAQEPVIDELVSCHSTPERSSPFPCHFEACGRVCSNLRQLSDAMSGLRSAHVRAVAREMCGSLARET